MQRMIEPTEYLNEELERRIRKNAGYSLRSFANALKLSPGELSEILRGKRRLSLKGAFKVIKALGLAPKEAERFLHSVQLAEAERSGLPFPKNGLSAHNLSEDFFHLVADWYCFAILSLSETRGFRFEGAPIAKRLGISATEARVALKRLERVGLLRVVNKKVEVTPDYIISPDEIPNEAVRKCHEQFLDLAKQALEEQAIDEREVNGVTFSIDPKRLPQLKKDLKKFMDQWAEQVSTLDRSTRTEVYHLETLLFRLTRKGTRS